MSDTSNVTETLARFVAETPAARIPNEVRHEAKRALLNMLAAGIRGAINPTYEKLLHSLPMSGRGHHHRPQGAADVLSATFLNAAGANIDDFDDTHLPTMIHPTAPVMPALLCAVRDAAGAAAPSCSTPSRSASRSRAGSAMRSRPGTTSRGWHITSSCGVFGAAAAAGSLSLERECMAWALGGASAQSSGLVEILGIRRRASASAPPRAAGSRPRCSRRPASPVRPSRSRPARLHIRHGRSADLPAIADGLGEQWESWRTRTSPTRAAS